MAEFIEAASQEEVPVGNGTTVTDVSRRMQMKMDTSHE